MTTAQFFVVMDKYVVPRHASEEKGLESAVDQHERHGEQRQDEDVRASSQTTVATVVELLIHSLFDLVQVVFR